MGFEILSNYCMFSTLFCNLIVWVWYFFRINILPLKRPVTIQLETQEDLIVESLLHQVEG